jgi:hypothetical protein
MISHVKGHIYYIIVISLECFLNEDKTKLLSPNQIYKIILVQFKHVFLIKSYYNFDKTFPFE